MGGETSYRIVPFITHYHYEVKAGSAPLPVLGARKETKVPLTRKNEFEVVAKQIDDLYYSIAMLEQSDVVEIDLLSNDGKFSPYRIPGNLLTGDMKSFLRQRMEEAINICKSQIASMTTVYPVEVPPAPTPVVDPAVPPAPPVTSDPVPVPQPDVPVQPVSPDAGPTPQ